jgi:preprotein translocase subunit SecA
MDEIKSSVYLQALGQGNPLLAYKEEVYQSFIEMQKNICEGIIKNMMHILIAKRKAEAASVWEQ